MPTSRLASLAFLMLFPFFFFYHTALALQIIPPVLGGYFSPVSLALAPFLFLSYAIEVHKNKALFAGTDLAFFAFLIYFLLVVSINSIFLNADREVVNSHLISILHFAAIFIIFKLTDFRSRGVWWCALACWVVMTIIIFNLSSDGFFYLREQEDSANQDYIATYQGFGRSYFVTILILVPFARTVPLRIVIYALSVAALFVNGSRSEFVATLLAIALIEILNARHRLIILCVAMVLAAFAAFYSTEFIQLLPENRTLELLHLSEASSWDERNFAFLRALETIFRSPALGDYGSYVDLGEQGLYAHNIFSAWVDLGFVGFVWLLLILLIPFCILAKEALHSRPDDDLPELVLTLELVAVTILLLFTAKEFTYMLTGAALGRYARYRYGRYRREPNRRLISRTRLRLTPVKMPQGT
jgi:hypothetical protein